MNQQEFCKKIDEAFNNHKIISTYTIKEEMTPFPVSLTTLRSMRKQLPESKKVINTDALLLTAKALGLNAECVVSVEDGEVKRKFRIK